MQDKLSLVPLSSYGKPYTPPAGAVDPSIDMKTAGLEWHAAHLATFLLKVLFSGPFAHGKCWSTSRDSLRRDIDFIADMTTTAVSPLGIKRQIVEPAATLDASTGFPAYGIHCFGRYRDYHPGPF
jgi:hypothetical protein